MKLPGAPPAASAHSGAAPGLRRGGRLRRQGGAASPPGQTPVHARAGLVPPAAGRPAISPSAALIWRQRSTFQTSPKRSFWSCALKGCLKLVTTGKLLLAFSSFHRTCAVLSPRQYPNAPHTSGRGILKQRAIFRQNLPKLKHFSLL